MAGTLRAGRDRGRKGQFGLLIVAAVLAGGAVAGCGTVPAPGTAGSSASGGTAAGSGIGGGAAKAHLTLCPGAGAVTAVTVSRYPSLPGAPVVRRIAKVTITNKTRARTLAVAICALPVIPSKPLPCPLNLAGTYRLAFSSAGARYRLVTIEASGCQTVTGTGTVRWVARTPGFWPVLAKIIGIEVPMHPAWPAQGN